MVHQCYRGESCRRFRFGFRASFGASFNHLGLAQNQRLLVLGRTARRPETTDLTDGPRQAGSSGKADSKSQSLSQRRSGRTRIMIRARAGHTGQAGRSGRAGARQAGGVETY